MTASAPAAASDLRPTTVLVCALGGEGGGVLTEWLVDAARHAGFAVQATSVPGVAQRTGATTYYLELCPQPIAALAGRRPVFGLTPVPGGLDLLVSSELLETVRQCGNGIPDPARTRILTSTARTLTTTERMQPGDGRLDGDALLAVIAAQSRTHLAFDMAAMARAHGTVVSAVLFGAIAGSGVLPLPRASYEAAIRGVDAPAGAPPGASATASLAGFAAALAHVASAVGDGAAVAGEGAADASGAATGEGVVATAEGTASLSPTSPHGRAGADGSPQRAAPAASGRAGSGAMPTPSIATSPTATTDAVAATAASATAHLARFPTVLHGVLALAHGRLVAYQDARYAALYLERLQPILDADRADPAHAATREAARSLAVWMAFDDIVRVADAKSRASRLARVRREVRAGDDVLAVWDHFKPGLPEIAGLLPAALARRLLAHDERRVAAGREPWAMPMRIGAHTVFGTLALRALAACKPLRRAGARWREEQDAIEGWLAAVVRATCEDPRLGLEVARAGQLVKGYGATNARGKARLADVVARLAFEARSADGASAASVETRIGAVAQARSAARRDDTGQALDAVLATHGVAPRPPAERPIRFIRRLPADLAPPPAAPRTT